MPALALVQDLLAGGRAHLEGNDLGLGEIISPASPMIASREQGHSLLRIPHQHEAFH